MEPALGDRDSEAGRLFDELGEVALAALNSAAQQGMRTGAAVEYLRRAALWPRTLCDECHGLGARNGMEDGKCIGCRGLGTVPTEGYGPESE